MSDGSPTLEVGFTIDTGGSFSELVQLEAAMGSAEAKILKEAANIERATNGMLNMGAATASVSAFGGAATRELASVARETIRAEKAAEGMVRQLDRQIETFGKSASQIRQMRTELKAVAAESQGLTELAARLRATGAEMDRLEAGMNNGADAAGKNRQAMMGASYQVQDFITQVSMGANPINAFAVQSGQLAGQFANVEGKAGNFARFMMGPWGLAITAGVMVLGMLFDRLMDASDASKKAEDSITDLAQQFDFAAMSAQELAEVNALLAKANSDIERTAIGAANATRMKAEADRDAARSVLLLAEAENARISAFMRDPMFAEGAAAYSGYLNVKGAEATAEKIAELRASINGFTEDANRSRFNAEVLTAGLDEQGRAAEALHTTIDGLRQAYQETGDARFLDSAIRAQAELNALENDARERPERRDRASENRAASQLRNAAATEAEIRNQYLLSAAFRESGAGALLAAAAVKAESDAIRQRGVVTAEVERQVRLEIANRVAGAAQEAAAVRDRVRAQDEVNAMVVGGLVPAERAAEIVSQQIADLPLLAALQVAQMRGLADETEQATRALEDQRAAREDLRQSELNTQFNAADAENRNRLAMLAEELRLVGATNVERARGMAILAAQQALPKDMDPAQRGSLVAQEGDIAAQQELLAQAQRNHNAELSFTADLWGEIAANVSLAGQGMADAFGDAGRALGGLATIYAGYHADRERMELQHRERIRATGGEAAAMARENHLFALQTATMQVGAFGDAAAAAKGFFEEGTDGYKALAAAEKAFRAVEFALSVRAMAQDVAETGAWLINSGLRTAASGVEAVVKAIASLPFPLNIAAGAATAAVVASLGVAIAGSFGGGGAKREASNTGTGTVFGDSSAQSESLQRSIDQLREVDTLTSVYARQMAASLRSIDGQIGGLASLVARTGDINASAGVSEGFKKNLAGSLLSAIPLIGGILGGLFGTKTTVVGSGLQAGPQSLGSVLGGGFDANYFSDVEKKKKLFGFTTGTSYSTQFTGADAQLETQFTLLLRQFNDAIVAAAGPLGAATGEIQNRLNGFVINLGKIDLQGLTGTEIEEKLNAVFGAAADNMAQAAFPIVSQFQKVGEGAFETLVRVASTVEAVSSSLDLLGQNAQGMGVAAKIALADQFGSIADLTSAADAYFQTFYTKDEQSAARTAQLGKVFTSLGLTLPNTLAAFRDLVEAQDLTTAAGQATYATLLQLSPAFADLKAAMEGAKSAADVAGERADLERQLLEVQGNTVALRALQLGKIDESNRALQQQIWITQDAQEAARAAEQLREAWTSVGDGIMDEVNRIRGIGGTETGSFASVMGQFNAANAAARGGDQEAAGRLPALSQELLRMAAAVASSRQELDRVQAQTASVLEQTYAAVTANMNATPANSDAALVNAAAQTQAAAVQQVANDNLIAEVRALRAEVANLRSDNNAGHAANAANTGAIKRHLDNVTSASGGDAIQTVIAA